MDKQLLKIPLLFCFTQVVAGNGFFAGIRMDGRALLETEQVGDHEEEWITGIAPVGIAGGGCDRSVAFVEFRKAWVEVLFDLAAKASTFKEFRASCEGFLAAQQDDMTGLWEQAVEDVRTAHYVDPSLRTGDADKGVRFEVVDLTHVGASGNLVEKGLQVAA
jgi:hypothetical protein